MNNKAWRIILLCALLGAIMSSLWTARMSRQSFANFDKAMTRLRDAREGESYACGYLAGQRAIARAFGHPEVGPPGLESCPPFAENAARNGFSQQ